MDKGLIGPMLHLVVFVLRILVWFPWVLSVMLLPPLVEHCELLLKLFVVLAGSLRLSFIVLHKIRFVKACRNLRSIPLLLFVLFEHINQVNLIILIGVLFDRILIWVAWLLEVFVLAFILAHEVRNLLLGTLQELVDLTLPLMFNRVVSSLRTWRVDGVSGAYAVRTTWNLDSWLGARWTWARGSHFSMIALLRMLHVFALNVLVLNLVILNIVLH